MWNSVIYSHRLLEPHNGALNSIRKYSGTVVPEHSALCRSNTTKEKLVTRLVQSNDQGALSNHPKSQKAA